MRRSARCGVVLLGLALAGCGGDATGPDPDGTPPDTVASPPREARALWLSRWDWAGRDELLALIDSAAAAHFNIIYLQVRARADSYYSPGLEPWAHRPPAFVLGVDPGWDPLAAALARAHARGLELHAWINTLIGWCTTEPIPETTPRHILLAHPDWQMLDQQGRSLGENCNFLTPGAPAVRDWIGAVVADLVRRYPVDGVHLDYIRYPDQTFSYDRHSQDSFAAARVAEPTLSFDEHRRRLVTATVRAVRDSLRTARAGIALSAAVWGVYRNSRGWPGVAAGYDTRFQDSRGWIAAGIVDVIVPMIYWPVQPAYGDRLDFAYLAEEFAGASPRGRVYVGMGGEYPADDFCTGCDVVRQIYRARRAGALGVSVFSARVLAAARLWDALRTGPFKAPVPVPPFAADP